MSFNWAGCIMAGVTGISFTVPASSAQMYDFELTQEERNALVDCDESSADFRNSVSMCRDEYGALFYLVTQSPIVVWGDRIDTDPGSFATLDADAVLAESADHPAEILNTLPGVNVHLNSGQEHLVAIRSPVLTGGAGQGSFLILENGIPTRASAFGNVNMLLEPHHEVASAIEVVRGPGSAKYGSNAVHGLINVILPDPEFSDLAPLELRASGSTLSRYKADLIAHHSGDIDAVAALSLQDDLGWRDFTGVQQQKASAVARFGLGEWDATAWASASSLNQETAGFIRGFKSYRDRDIAESNPNPEAYRDAWSARAAIRLQQDFDFGTLSITPVARTQRMEFLQHFVAWQPFEKNGHDSLGLNARVDTGAGRADIRYGGTIEWANGYLREVQERPFGFFPGDGRFPVGVHYDYDVDTLVGALWGEAEWQLAPNLRALAGLRVEQHGYSYTTDAPVGINGRFNVVADRDDDFTLVTPKFGVVWDIQDQTAVYANLARGRRAPQATDLYRLQSNQVAGEIDEETLDSLEIGIRGTRFGDRFTYDIAAYAMKKENFFFRDSDGLNVTDGETAHLGVEASGQIELTDVVNLSGQLSWSDQTYAFDRAANGIVDGNEIDTAPEWLGDLSVIWTPTDTLNLTAKAQYMGEYFTDAANRNTYPGHTVVDLRGAYSVSDTLEAFVIVRNLFDVAYADRADFAFGSDRYFPGEPINTTFGIRKRFE